MDPYVIYQNGCEVHLTDIESVIEIKKKIQQKVVNLKIELKENNEDLEKMKKFLRINCKHNIVSDYIDLLEGYRESVYIKYCDKCELNFKELS